MIILVCGMHRSASTLIWQIVHRLYLGHPGFTAEEDYGAELDARAWGDPRRIQLVKVHAVRHERRGDLPLEAAHHLYTYRDLRDSVASLYRKGRLRRSSPRRTPEEAAQIAKRELAAYVAFTARPNLWVGRYEDFYSKVPDLVTELAGFLGLGPLPTETRMQIADDVGLDKQRERVPQAETNKDIRQSTFLTTNHITDSRAGTYPATLTEDEIAAIEAVAGRWLLDHGYTLSAGRHGKDPPVP